MKIIALKDDYTDQIIDILNEGGLVVFPCETVYGIGCDATNRKAVEKLSGYKQRPLGKPYAVMVCDVAMAQEYAELNQTAKKLYSNYLPGPLTVVSRGKNKLAVGVESETGTLGVRIPDYSFLLKVIKKFGKPLAATSANSSYGKRPYKISDILENISEKQKRLIQLVVDAGELPRNEPSTVIDTTLDDSIVLRQGEIKINDINEIVSRSEENTRNFGKEIWQKYSTHGGKRAIVFALEGPMGTGKTQMTKGLAKAMGITDEILSPTFNLELEYESQDQIKLTHIDAWRMHESAELEELGVKNRINDKSVIVIEWADRVGDVIRKLNEEAVVVWVKISYGKKVNERIINWGTL